LDYVLRVVDALNSEKFGNCV